MVILYGQPNVWLRWEEGVKLYKLLAQESLGRKSQPGMCDYFTP